MNEHSDNVGALGGLCNRTACRAPGAQWWNPHMRKYYCTACARQLNDVFRRGKIALCQWVSVEKTWR